ncbi:antibiotic biosynthesis monooxygenase [Phormidium tenue FACHB-886]|nr:antibiotic biosynthesis monooxygenase [Phormidium tenue FACHB-886]
MTEMQLTIVSVLKAKPGMEDALKESLLAIVKAVRLRSGVINLDLHQYINDPSRFMLYENWVSRKDFDNYHSERSPEDNAFRAKADELLAEPIAPSFWQMFSEEIYGEQQPHVSHSCNEVAG